MDTVIPVELRLLGDDDESDFAQGFTRDVSAGGMCVELKLLNKSLEKVFLPERHVDLVINPPFARRPVRAAARIVWTRRREDFLPHRLLIGVAYTHIDAKARGRIIKYARRLRWLPRLAAVAGLLLVGLLAWSIVREQELVQENKALVSALVESAERKSQVSGDLYHLQERRAVLARELERVQQTVAALEESLSSAAEEHAEQRAAHQAELAGLIARRSELDAEIRSLQAGREKLKATYTSLEKTEELTATNALRQMYQWLKSHQNRRTGLVASYEGDPTQEDVAYTYDQSLASQAFGLFGDLEDAALVLTFYDRRAERGEGGALYNAYHALDGSPVENVVHAGPNVWIAIAAMQYENRVRDGRFLPLARRIGDWLLSMQDAEGGVPGGPGLTWYSTEHNLDTYVCFRMLHRLTGDARYERASEASLAWIQKYAYSVREGRMNRGKGDATIATDTFSWAIATIGPERLAASGFDPEEIVRFAEEHCEVEVYYRQAGGRTARARGFDFAKAQNIGRGGVISTEWTAQMIVTYQILSRHFRAAGQDVKAGLYEDKADFYLNELQKLIITSPSRTGQGRGCLPYASQDGADTGHGWRTPRGPRTGSVSGTAYGLFAWVGYNPFDLDNQLKVS